MSISSKKIILSLLIVFSVLPVLSFWQTTDAQSLDPYWLEYKDSSSTHFIKGPYTSQGACETWWEQNNANQFPPWVLVKSCFPSATTPTVTPESTTPPANTKTTYTPLAPLPGIGTPDCVDEKTGEPCIDTKESEKNPCPFGQYLNLMIKLFFGICGVLAVVMVLMGGIQYMTSDLVSSKEEGKNTIVHAILGLLLALGAWLILNTLNPNLLNVCLNTLPPAEITIVEDDSVPQSAVNGKYCAGTTGANGGYSANADWATIAGAVKTLPNGVVSNHPGIDCTSVGQQGCTSLRNLDMSKVNFIKTKCTNCGTITVSGGTECWLHGGTKQKTTHRPSSPTIDLRFETNLDAYIKSGTKKESWYTKDGIDYLLESDHWHVGH